MYFADVFSLLHYECFGLQREFYVSAVPVRFSVSVYVFIFRKAEIFFGKAVKIRREREFLLRLCEKMLIRCGMNLL